MSETINIKLLVYFLVTVINFSDIFVCGEFTGYSPVSSNYVHTTPKHLSGDKSADSPAAGDLMRKIMSKGCSQQYTVTCLKLDVVSFVDKISQTDDYQILPGLSVIKDNTSDDTGESSRKLQSDLVASLAKDYPNDVDARLDAYLVKRIGHYLDTHSVTMKLLSADESSLETSDGEVETGRRRPGGKGGGGMMLAGLGMMKAALGAMGLGAAGLIAGKALMTGLMALMLSAIIGLKSLASGGKGHVTYEVISKPIVSHVNTHSHEVQHDHGHGGYGHSSYGRSFDLQPGSLKLQDEPQGVQNAYSVGQNSDFLNTQFSNAEENAQATLSSPSYASSVNSENAYERTDYKNSGPLIQSLLPDNKHSQSILTGNILRNS